MPLLASFARQAARAMASPAGARAMSTGGPGGLSEFVATVAATGLVASALAVPGVLGYHLIETGALKL